jgi:hypothetical protein
MLHRDDRIRTDVNRSHVVDDWTPPVLVRREPDPLIIHSLHLGLVGGLNNVRVGNADLRIVRYKSTVDPGNIWARHRRHVDRAVHLPAYQHAHQRRDLEIS